MSTQRPLPDPAPYHDGGGRMLVGCPVCGHVFTLPDFDDGEMPLCLCSGGDASYTWHPGGFNRGIRTVRVKAVLR